VLFPFTRKKSSVSFSDPEVITLDSVATDFNRTGSGLLVGTFATDDGLTEFSVKHQVGRRYRRMVRLDQRQYAEDPIVPANNILASASVYLVIDHPMVGYTNAEVKILVDGLVDWLDASSGAKVTQLLQGEG